MANKHQWYRPRRYLHFDPPVGYKLAQKIATSPARVASHSFYPLIAYHVTSKKIKHDSSTGDLVKKTKCRPIAYAAHSDSHIYSYYAWTLSKLYESELRRRGISDRVLAFRPLGKSNVDFAAAAFQEIRGRGECSAVALDISGFFDNLDHSLIKRQWTALLGETDLPADHYAVFKSLTKFSVVNKNRLYTSLGISLHNPKKGRHRICDPHTFRVRVRDEGMIEVNSDKAGIPQGTPISALLSNIYMIDFDLEMSSAVKKVGGIYYRYCDDMLFVVPKKFKNKFSGIARKNIGTLELDINVDKTELRDFYVKNGRQKSDKPLQYLGFTYDGRHILIRSAALARYSEKMKRGVHLAKATMRKRNKIRAEQGESTKLLFRKKLYNRYSHLGKRNFVRYGLRSADIMESNAIKKQLKPLWKRLKHEIES